MTSTWRLRLTKYIKVLKKNKPYHQTEIAKYIKKGVKYFYLKKEDQLKFLEDSVATLLDVYIEPTRTTEAIVYHIECFAILQQYIR